jgi:hypothetical protein
MHASVLWLHTFFLTTGCGVVSREDEFIERYLASVLVVVGGGVGTVQPGARFGVVGGSVV